MPVKLIEGQTLDLYQFGALSTRDYDHVFQDTEQKKFSRNKSSRLMFKPLKTVKDIVRKQFKTAI